MPGRPRRYGLALGAFEDILQMFSDGVSRPRGADWLSGWAATQLGRQMSSVAWPVRSTVQADGARRSSPAPVQSSKESTGSAGWPLTWDFHCGAGAGNRTLTLSLGTHRSPRSSW